MEFQIANKNDLQSLVYLFADDELGSQRERDEEPLSVAYYEVFNAMES